MRTGGAGVRRAERTLLPRDVGDDNEDVGGSRAVSRRYFSVKIEVSMAQKEERVQVNFIWHFQFSVQKTVQKKKKKLPAAPLV